MSSKKRGDFLRVLLCPPVLAVVAFLSTWGQKALRDAVDISFDSSLTLVLFLSPIAFYLVIGLLLAVMLDVSDEIRGSLPIRCIIIIELLLLCAFFFSATMMVYFTNTVLYNSIVLTVAGLLYLLVKNLRKPREA